MRSFNITGDTAARVSPINYFSDVFDTSGTFTIPPVQKVHLKVSLSAYKRSVFFAFLVRRFSTFIINLSAIFLANLASSYLHKSSFCNGL
jgi:hypothetical protein